MFVISRKELVRRKSEQGISSVQLVSTDSPIQEKSDAMDLIKIMEIDIIWYDRPVYDMIWYDMIWYDMIWYDMIWNGMICYDIIWYVMI